MREGMGKGVDVFLLTHPLRGVTLIRDGLEAGLDVFLLTHPSRGVTATYCIKRNSHRMIKGWTIIFYTLCKKIIKKSNFH